MRGMRAEGGVTQEKSLQLQRRGRRDDPRLPAVTFHVQANAGSPASLRTARAFAILPPNWQGELCRSNEGGCGRRPGWLYSPQFYYLPEIFA